MHYIENEFILIEVKDLGAEMNRIFHKHYKKDYLWSGDPAFWGRKAPILFPIVGKLKNNNFSFKNKNYHLGQHGFARDLNFILTNKTETSLTFECKSNNQTKIVYPFDWLLRIKYSIEAEKICVVSTVFNTSGIENLFFSIGFHPAFKIPLNKDENIANYKLHFNNDMQAFRWLIEEGLIGDIIKSCIKKGKIELNENTFDNDALVFKNLNSNEVTLTSNQSKNGIKMKFVGFPYFGIWSKPNANFICLEPWHGIADGIDHQTDICLKEGINHLRPNEQFECGYEITVF